MERSIHDLKQQILRLYRTLDPRSLDGLKKVAGGYITADGKWLYVVSHGGFIEREASTATSQPEPIGLVLQQIWGRNIVASPSPFKP